jgi:hypothetical protein
MPKLPEAMGGGSSNEFSMPDDSPVVPIDSEPFFQSGSIELHFLAPRGNDTQLNRSEAAAMTRAANEVAVLKKNFIDGVTPVFRKSVPGKGIVQVMVPSSPYAYGGVMVVSAGAELVSAENADLTGPEVPTETAFDLDQDMRREFYRQILGSIQAEEDVALPRQGEDSKVIAYENTVVSISNEQHRLPRSIVLPHMHIIKSGDWINSDITPPRPHGFHLEQRLLQSPALLAQFRDQWFMPALQQSDTLSSMPTPSLELRGAAPYGYTVATGIGRDEPLKQQAQKLSDLLYLHHAAYSAFATYESRRVNEGRAKRREEFIRNGGMLLPRIPSVRDTFPVQPAYRTYLYYRDGELATTISPMLITTLGAMEGMGTAVNRGLHHERIFTDDELVGFFSNLTDRLHTLLSPNSDVNSEGA